MINFSFHCCQSLLNEEIQLLDVGYRKCSLFHMNLQCTCNKYISKTIKKNSTAIRTTTTKVTKNTVFLRSTCFAKDAQSCLYGLFVCLDEVPTHAGEAGEGEQGAEEGGAAEGRQGDPPEEDQGGPYASTPASWLPEIHYTSHHYTTLPTTTLHCTTHNT